MTAPLAVVILTGGYTPAVQGYGEPDVAFGQRMHAAPDQAPPAVLERAREHLRPETAGADPWAPRAVHADDLDAAVTEAWRHGWHEAAMEYRIVRAWLVPEDQAAAFAAFVTAEIDPAHVVRPACPVAELLGYAEMVKTERNT